MDIVNRIINDKDLLIIAAAAFILYLNSNDYKLPLILGYVFLFTD